MAVLGALVTWLHIWAPWRSYEKILPRPEVYVEIQALVTDDRMLDDDSLSDLTKTKNIEVNITKLRLSQFEEWQTCRGKILIIKPTIPLEYGMSILIKGALVLPWKNEIPGLFNYRNYLKSKGIKHVMRGDELIVTDSNPMGWRKAVQKFIHVREGLLGRIIRYVDGDRNQKILAAMTLGFRQSLSPEDKQIYLRSGMIHILAISGLHVGVLFSLILFIFALSRVPFTLRYLFAPFVLLLYVIAAGGSPSAARAWLMLTLWSVGRGLKLPVVSMNAILAAALFLLIYKPFYIFQSGFQFSFIVVLSLVGGWNRGKTLILYFSEKGFWVPPYKHSSAEFFEKIRNIASGSIVSMGSAWIGSLGLTAFYNQLFIPSSILTNIFVCFWAWIIIILGTVKTLLSYLPFLIPEFVLAKLLSGCLSMMHFVGEFSAHYGNALTTQHPSLVITLGYYSIVLAMLFQPLGLRKSIRLLVPLCGFILYFIFPIIQLTERPKINVLVPVNSIVPIVTILPSGIQREAIVINSGTRRFGNTLSSSLQNRGIGAIDKLIILNNRVDYYGGCADLFKKFVVRSFSVCITKNKRAIGELYQLQWKNGTRWRLFAGTDIIGIQECQITRNIGENRHNYYLRLKYQRRWIFHIEISVDIYQGSWVKIVIKDCKNNLITAREWNFLYTNKHRVESF